MLWDKKGKIEIKQIPIETVTTSGAYLPQLDGTKRTQLVMLFRLSLATEILKYPGNKPQAAMAR